MDDQANTTDTAAPTAGGADQAIENWIAAGRKVVEQHLAPLERLANSGSPFAHEFAVAKNAFAAALHSVLSHVAHEDHPGVIAEAAKLSEPVIEDVEGAIGAAAEGSITGVIGEGSAAVTDAVAGAAKVASDLAAGTPLVSSEDVASVEAAVVDGIAGSSQTPAPQAEPSAEDLLG